MACSHHLDAEYLYPSDAEVVGIQERGDSLEITVLLPCPDCDETLRVETGLRRVVESDRDLPLDDSSDLYD